MIKVVSALRSLILTNIQIRDIIKDRIYPNLIPISDGGDNVNYPCIVLTRTGMTVEDSKDRGMPCSNQEAQVEVVILSSDYDEAVDIADKLYKTVMRYQGTQNDLFINDIRYEGSFEAYTEGAYRQVLNFKIRGL